MANHDSTINQVERELIVAFRSMPPRAAEMLFGVAKAYQRESIENKKPIFRLIQGGLQK